MSEEGTSERKHVMNENIIPGTTENAASGKTKIYKKFKIINSHEKYVSIYISNIDSTRMMTSYEYML